MGASPALKDDVYMCAEGGAARISLLCEKYIDDGKNRRLINPAGNRILEHRYLRKAVYAFVLSERAEHGLVPRLIKMKNGEVPGMCTSEVCGL